MGAVSSLHIEWLTCLIGSCSSVHNTRIERLWVDVKAQLTGKWADFFASLEIYGNLDAANANHIWLLQYLFLTDLNQELQSFVNTWNLHSLRRRGERTRSPYDRFNFDMHVCGLRGDPRSELGFSH